MRLNANMEDVAADILESINALHDYQTQKTDGTNSSEGLSLLAMKNELFIQYMANVMLLMTKQDEEVDLACRKRIATLRIYMEKIRPVEAKLEYKIDKLMSVARGVDGSDGSLFHKPRPDNFDCSDDESASDGCLDQIDTPSQTSNKYKIPKHMSVPYVEDGRGNDSDDEADGEQALDLAARRRKRLSRAMLDELRDQYSETPDEIAPTDDGLCAKVSAKQRRFMETMRERTQYEEDNFVRLPMTKKDRKMAASHMRQSFATVNNIGRELVNFGFNQFDSDGHDVATKASRGGAKSKMSQKGRTNKRLPLKARKAMGVMKGRRRR